MNKESKPSVSDGTKTKTDGEKPGGGDAETRWQRKRFKGNKVWMAIDAGGRPIKDKNKVRIKYQLEQPHEYWVRPDKIEDLNTSAPEYRSAPEPGPSEPKSPRPAAQPVKKKSSQAPEPGAPVITVYTDGASSGNPGPSGIGVLLRYGAHEKEISRYIGTSTNNIAELLAVKTALEAIQRKDLPVRLYTDSSYVHGLLTKGWKAHKNRELVEETRSLCQGFRDLELIKVAGHAGLEGNERADSLATSAIEKKTR